ncbi:hypothetical protein [Brevibacterium sp.]|uniref:hypothetical protein n=1 Tax=Brevibacterium sp. TaxID=1701 RepID=UPI0028123575|nr:hypothetical protein [Brevibacterium sp.]
MDKPIEEMTPEEIAQWMEALKSELLRRQNREAFQREETKLHEQFRQTGMLPVPAVAEYVKPAESVDAYGVGDVVLRNGGRRRATTGLVICEPECNDHWEDA